MGIARASLMGRWWVTPTMSGDIRWRNQDWGIILRDVAYSGHESFPDAVAAPEVRIPWDVLRLILSSKDAFNNAPGREYLTGGTSKIQPKRIGARAASLLREYGTRTPDSSSLYGEPPRNSSPAPSNPPTEDGKWH